MVDVVRVDVEELTELGVDIALQVLCGAPEDCSSNWSVLGPWLEEHHWEVSYTDETNEWDGRKADYSYSVTHPSLKVLVARLRILEALSTRKGFDVVFRMEGAKAKLLFHHTNQVAKTVYAGREYSDEKIDLLLVSSNFA